MILIERESNKKRGFQAELFDIDRVEMHGPGSLKKNKLVLYLANCEEHSGQTAVRLFWSEKMALDMLRYVNEETIVFVSFANPYHRRDNSFHIACNLAILICGTIFFLLLLLQKVSGQGTGVQI